MDDPAQDAARLRELAKSTPIDDGPLASFLGDRVLTEFWHAFAPPPSTWAEHHRL